MRTNHLLYFVEVAKQQSISKASKKLFISQPSLSASIANLEEELGVKLFYRSRSGATLTEQGQQILALAENILRDVEQIEAISRQDNHLTGLIRIAAIPSACDNLLLDLIMIARERYPQLAIDIKETRPKIVINQVADGEVNLGISSYIDHLAANYQAVLQEKRLQSEILYQDRLCVYVAKAHPFAARGAVSYAEATEYPMTGFTKDVYMQKLTNNPELLSEYDAQGFPVELFPNICYRFNSLASIKKIAASNLAIALFPESLGKIDAYTKDGLLVPISINDLDLSVTVILIYKMNQMLSIEEQKTVEMLKFICKQYQ